MKRIISTELVQRIANALATMTGLSYVQVQQLINELSQLEEYKENGKINNGEEKDIRQTKSGENK